MKRTRVEGAPFESVLALLVVGSAGCDSTRNVLSKEDLSKVHNRRLATSLGPLDGKLVQALLAQLIGILCASAFTTMTCSLAPASRLGDARSIRL